MRAGSRYHRSFHIVWHAETPNAAQRKGVQQRMIKVKARGSESVEQMLKRFKKLCEKEGLTKDIKRNSYYEKPSERRRRRARKSIKRVSSGPRR